ncbi:MAG: hypothetical protein K5829_13990 [Treponema sp.]|nr:hypothetical protein [Treponema sp.]
MTSRPLVGKNSSPHVSSLFIAILVTSFFWITFSVAAFLLAPFEKHEKFETVQIVLNSTPFETKSQPEESIAEEESISSSEEDLSAESPVEETLAQEVESPAVEDLPLQEEAPQAAPLIEEKPAPLPEKPKVETKPKPSPVPTPAPAKPLETPDNKKVDFDNFEYAKDYSEGFDFSENKASNSQTFDWDSFDNTTSTSSSTNNNHTVASENAIIGSAAKTSENVNQRQSGGGKKDNKTQAAASDSTSDMLNKVKESNYSATLDDGSKAISTLSTQKKDGMVALSMNDGSTRLLLDPMFPSIKLSAEAAQTLDSDRSVKISFSVAASGNVVEISITPESILPEKVRSEIREQLKKWKFESSSSTATANFEYSIIKK